MSLQTAKLKENYDYLAPDGSEIRLLLDGERGTMSHCLLPIGKVSQAVKHRTVEEIWYIIEGTGKLWRSGDEEKDKKDELSPGVCITIYTGTKFQFKNIGDTPLKILITCMPVWPGPEEVILVENYWK